MIYDTTTGKLVDKIPIGLLGQMSIRRLVNEVMRQSGEIKPEEKITHIEFDGVWIRYRIDDQ